MKVSKKKIIYCIIVIVLLIGLAYLGTYVGECNINIISAKVEVTVKSGKISNINLLEHKNE
ncbi:hypothetical protein [Clostridioides sp. ES-S-0006-03]